MSSKADLPPGPRGRPLVGCLLEMHADALGFLSSVTRRYGDLVHYRLGLQPVVLVNRPEHVRRLVAEQPERYVVAGSRPTGVKGVIPASVFGAPPAARRGPVSEAPPDADAHARHAAEVTLAELSRWRDGAAGSPLDIVFEMQRLTLKIHLLQVFGFDIGHMADAFVAAINTLRDHETSRPLVPLPSFVPSPAGRRVRAARQTFSAVARAIFEHYRDTAAAKRADAPAVLTPRDITGLVFASYDTTSSALTWTWHLLARHPEVEARLEAELDEVLAGRPPGPEEAGRLRYLQQVLKESMRLYPPAWLLNRVAMSEDRIDGFRIPEGSTVSVCPYLLHRHPTYWEEPDRFDPERFAPERARSRPQYVYVPFGGGPYRCPGQHIGITTLTTVVALVKQRFRLRRSDGGEIRPKATIFSLRPDAPLRMTFEPRA